MSECVTDVSEPVRRLPTDREDEPTSGTAVCLSGGGYRAMLFHAGVMWRLYETRWLDRVDRVSSVSGGSITAGVVARAWGDLGCGTGTPVDRAGRFRDLVITPLRELAGRTVDRPSVVSGLLSPFTTIGQQIAGEYRTTLFAGTALADLPEHPTFVFNATNTGSGKLVRFSRDWVADWRVGRVESTATDLATAVACSSAFPPFLSPYELPLDGLIWKTDEGNDLVGTEYRDAFFLTDGGVYDNLGLETAWKRCRTLFVSDAGGDLTADPDPARDWAQHLLRVVQVLDHQVRSLRKRQVVGSLVDRRRDGAYVGIRSDLANYRLADALPAPVDATTRLAEISTRLKKMSATQQERLINWGYAITDAALRRHVDDTIPVAHDFPYPSAGVG